jgi:hypothetical protein
MESCFLSNVVTAQGEIPQPIVLSLNNLMARNSQYSPYKKQ